MIKLPKLQEHVKEASIPTKIILQSSNVAVENPQKYIPVPTHIAGTSTQTVNELGKQLLKAAREGDLNEIKTLLSKGATFTADWLGTSPLHLAARNNHLEVCELLLRAGISRDARTKVDKTPLHMAAYEGHNDVVELLLQNGADCDARDLLAMTPLHWAVQNGHADVVATLIRHGCQIDPVNKFNLAPIHIASQIDRQDIIDMLNTSANTEMQNTIDATQCLAAELSSNDASNESAVHMGNADQTENQDVSSESIPLEAVSIDNMDQAVESDDVIHSQTESEDASMDETIQDLNDHDDSFTDSLKLLQEHGITMLPADDNNILASVMENGHSVVLTDVGKEVLNTVKLEELSKLTEPVQKMPEKRKIITLTPDEFLALANNSNFVSRLNYRKIAPKTVKRIVMKKNKVVPVSSLTNSAIQNQLQNFKDGSDMETVMTQLIEARKTIEEYKVKLQKKEQEAERYKQQLKLLMDSS